MGDSGKLLGIYLTLISPVDGNRCATMYKSVAMRSNIGALPQFLRNTAFLTKSLLLHPAMTRFIDLSKHERKVQRAAEREFTARREAVFRAIQDNDKMCRSLAAALEKGNYLYCSRKIVTNFRRTGLFSGKKGQRAIHDLLSWAGKDTVKNTINPHLAGVMRRMKGRNATHHTAKRRLITAARLKPDSGLLADLYSGIPTITVTRLATPFPPPYLYVSESEAIYDKNMKFVLRRNLPDGRKWRKLIYKLDDPERLVYDLPPDESAVFEDENGKLVAVVIRNACGHEGVLEFLDSSIDQVVATRRNVRVSITDYFT